MFQLEVVHVDIKPDNILIDGKGHLIFADFGFSYHSEVPASYKVMSQVAGTHGYIAPEIYKSNDYSKVADWYSTGVILGKLCNKLPETELSDDLKDLVMHLMEKDPQNRLGALGSSEVRNHNYFKVSTAVQFN